MSTVLITGANRGIGLATAIELAKRGHRVFGGTRSLSNAGELQQSAEGASVHVEAVKLDVSSSESVARAVNDVIALAGGLDIAVNNAAATGVPGVDVTPLELTDEAATAVVLDTNLHGPLRVIRAVLPHLRARGSGRIVNVSSQLAHPRLGVVGSAVYGASKAGLHALTLSLAREVEPLSVTVVLVEGGVLARTDGFDASIERARDALGAADSSYADIIAPFAKAITAMDPAALPAPRMPAAIIAGACLDPDPERRHHIAAQVHIDAANQIRDRDFQKLVRGGNPTEILKGYELPMHF